MSGPFKEEHLKAAVKEIETLEAMDTWEDDDHTKEMN